MSEDNLKQMARAALEELKGQDILEIDVHEMTSVTDTLLIASGTSAPAREVARRCGCYGVQKTRKATHRGRG